MNNPDAISPEEGKWLDNKHKRIDAAVEEMLSTLRSGPDSAVSHLVDAAVYDAVSFTEQVFKMVAQSLWQPNTMLTKQSTGEAVQALVLGHLEELATYREDDRTYDPVSDSPDDEQETCSADGQW